MDLFFEETSVKHLAISLFIAGHAALLAGCSDEIASGPPEILLGQDVCDTCNMIVSDARFAGATIVLDERGRASSRIFDDLNCQIQYETDHPDAEIATRWVHDYATAQWLAASNALYVRAESLITPMGSHTAAHADLSTAEALQQEEGGEVLGFEEVWGTRER